MYCRILFYLCLVTNFLMMNKMYILYSMLQKMNLLFIRQTIMKKMNG